MPLSAATALFVLVSVASASDNTHASSTPPATKSTPSSTKSTSTAKPSTPAKATTAKSTTVAANTTPRKRSAPATAAQPVPAPAPETVVEVEEAPPAGTTNIEVMAEVIALRADIVALQHLVEEQMRVPEPEPTPEEAAIAREKERMDERIVALREQRSRLDDAVAGGLDKAVAAPAIAQLDAELRAAEDARLRIDQPQPAATVVVEAPSGPALSFDVGVASAYAFRGLNVFAATTPQDAHGVLTPAITASFGDSGVTVGYWGAYQLNGDNAAALVDVGLGAESDLIFGWSRKVNDAVTVSAGATAYLYPFADADAAGTAAPVYVEPSVGVGLSKGVDLGLQVAAMYGVQEALAAYRYVYVRPSVGRALELPAGFTLVGGVSGGVKLYFTPDAPTDNVWDAGADLALNKTIADTLYVRPSAHAAWTNYESRSVGGSAFGWFGVNVGAAI